MSVKKSHKIYQNLQKMTSAEKVSFVPSSSWCHGQTMNHDCITLVPGYFHRHIFKPLFAFLKPGARMKTNSIIACRVA